MKLLLVDDHKLIGKSLEISLKKYSQISAFYHLDTPNGIDKVITDFTPDILLMDIHMGEYNGLHTAAEILEKKQLKIVFLTGFQLNEYQEYAEKIGAYGFIDKSIEIPLLVEQFCLIHKNDCRIFPEKNQVCNLTPAEKKYFDIFQMGVLKLKLLLYSIFLSELYETIYQILIEN